jgi:glyceraldehyde 3-phosphate dehydrogenase
MNHRFETELNNWIEREKCAIELMRIAANLWLDKSVELLVLRRKIYDDTVKQIINDHLYAWRYLDKPISTKLTLKLAEVIAKQDLPPARIDIGKLASEYIDAGQPENVENFIDEKLGHIINNKTFALKPKDVVLYGFGRIGRLAARILANDAGKGEQLRLKGIVTRGSAADNKDILKRANLLRKDSVHGKMKGTVVEDLENDAMIVNGQMVNMIFAKTPAEIDYTQYGIEDALVIDNTGVWRDKEALSEHLKAKGASKVLLTAPGKGDLPNIVYGVNHLTPGYKDAPIITAASCTTNAIVPVLDVVENLFGIERGHVETVHSYTNDQNLLDNYHKKFRRGKSAALNMVITETGASSAIAKVLPHLKGKFTGNAVRVPTPNVSLAILNLQLNKPTSVDEINNVLKMASLEGKLCEQIDFSLSNELVSTDVIGNPHASVVDAPATIVSPDGKSLILYVWYDNEFGYTKQVIRLAKYVGSVIRLTYY